MDKRNSSIFAVISLAVKSYNSGDRDKYYQDVKEQKAVGENKELVEFLKEKIKGNKVGIMLHGYSHLMLSLKLR